MDHAFIAGLADIVARSQLTELEYCEGGRRIRLSRGGAAVDAAPVADAPQPVVAETLASAGAAPDTPAAQAQDLIVRAGLGGVFYTRPSPGEPPFVQVGDTVQPGQPIALIEAMKMLNAVEADEAGVITCVLAEDGALVAPGAELYAMQA